MSEEHGFHRPKANLGEPRLPSKHATAPPQFELPGGSTSPPMMAGFSRAEVTRRQILVTGGSNHGPAPCRSLGGGRWIPVLYFERDDRKLPCPPPLPLTRQNRRIIRSETPGSGCRAQKFPVQVRPWPTERFPDPRHPATSSDQSASIARPHESGAPCRGCKTRAGHSRTGLCVVRTGLPIVGERRIFGHLIEDPAAGGSPIQTDQDQKYVPALLGATLNIGIAK